MNFFLRTTLAVCGLLLVAPAAPAQTLALSAQAGTMGPGLHFHYNAHKKINIRAGIHILPYAREDDYIDDSEDITLRAESDINWTSGMALVDFHPTGGGFRLTTGLFYNNNKAEVFAYSLDDYQYTDRKTFTAEKMGTLTGKLTWRPLNPYIGLGFGNTFRRRFNFQFDLGALWSGPPTIDLEGTGFIAPTANQDVTINDGIESFQFYPLLSFGVGVRLF